jgi:hypothetical protein
MALAPLPERNDLLKQGYNINDHSSHSNNSKVKLLLCLTK